MRRFGVELVQHRTGSVTNWICRWKASVNSHSSRNNKLSLRKDRLRWISFGAQCRRWIRIEWRRRFRGKRYIPRESIPPIRSPSARLTIKRYPFLHSVTTGSFTAGSPLHGPPGNTASPFLQPAIFFLPPHFPVEPKSCTIQHRMPARRKICRDKWPDPVPYNSMFCRKEKFRRLWFQWGKCSSFLPSDRAVMR